jgi:hypothetical protein
MPGGEVQADMTSLTKGDSDRSCCRSVAIRRIDSTSAWPGAVKTKISCKSPRWNVSARICAAFEDSADGSWNPPAGRELATGIPKTAAAITMSAVAANTRRGAAINDRVNRSSTDLAFRRNPTYQHIPWALCADPGEVVARGE